MPINSNSKVFFPVFFIFLLIPLLSFAEPHKSSMWEKSIKAYEVSDKTAFPQEGAALFVGSSSIAMWKTVADDFAPITVINRGFGGSWIRDSVKFCSRIITPYKPSKIVFYAGENDIAAGETPLTVTADFKRLERLIHQKLPETTIYFISIKPSPLRWDKWEKMQRANKLIRDFCESKKNVKFIDVASAMLKTDSAVRTDIFLDDNLHMNAEGYKIWTGIIKPLIEK